MKELEAKVLYAYLMYLSCFVNIIITVILQELMDVQHHGPDAETKDTAALANAAGKKYTLQLLFAVENPVVN